MFSIEFRCCAQPASQPASLNFLLWHFNVFQVNLATRRHFHLHLWSSSGRLLAKLAKAKARKSIYRISAKTTYSTFWAKTWKLCLACRSDSLLSVLGKSFPVAQFSSVQFSSVVAAARSSINAYLEAYLMS